MIEERKEGKVYRIIILILIVAILSSVGTLIYIRKFGNKLLYKEIEVNPAEEIKDLPQYLEEIDKALKSHYLGEVNEEKLLQGAIKGYVAGLGDPYTEYFTKDEMEEFETATEGNYVGIGIYMGVNKNDKIEVIAPIKGSPAAEAGIKAGDIISKVDGKEYNGKEITEASNYIKGKDGTKVNIEIIRKTEILNLEIERRKIDIAPVESKIINENIGYILLTTFDKDCSTELKSIVEDFNNKNVNGIILDLRDNGGGLVDEAVSILDMFVNKGENLLITSDKNGKEEITKAKKNSITDKKMVVLTNGGSASASEIVSGTLKDLKRATIVGEKTYGKGVIQVLLPISDGAGLKVTIEEYFTAGRNKINGVGIEPDEIVTDDKKTEVDEQLEKAIEIINK